MIPGIVTMMVREINGYDDEMSRGKPPIFAKVHFLKAASKSGMTCFFFYKTYSP